MPIAMKKLGRRGGPAGQDRKVPLPGRKQDPNKNKVSPTKKKPAANSMMRKGGMMKSKGMKKGGKMPMAKDPDTGKMVPAFAVDGKGKMRKGGMMKKKGYAKGGPMKKKGMKKGGMMKKGYAKGGKMSSKSMGSALKKFMDEGGFEVIKPQELSPLMKEIQKLGSLRKKRMGGMMKKKGMAKGGPMKKKGMKRGGAMMMKKKGMKKGGVMRGTGAATKGKKFTRAG